MNRVGPSYRVVKSRDISSGIRKEFPEHPRILGRVNCFYLFLILSLKTINQVLFDWKVHFFVVKSIYDTSSLVCSIRWEGYRLANKAGRVEVVAMATQLFEAGGSDSTVTPWF